MYSPSNLEQRRQTATPQQNPHLEEQASGKSAAGMCSERSGCAAGLAAKGRCDPQGRFSVAKGGERQEHWDRYGTLESLIFTFLK